MIPFFQSNSLDDKYISQPAEIEKFLNQSMHEQRLFQFTVPGLENETISRILAIDTRNRQISFEDSRHEFANIQSNADKFSVTAEVRADNNIMRFESFLLKNKNQHDRFIIHYPRELERNTKRQMPRYRPRKNFTIPVSLKIKDKWVDIAILSDISEKGLGIIIHEKRWKHVNKGLLTDCMINIENILTFECAVNFVHTFTVFNTGNKHAGGQFVNLKDSNKKELCELIERMLKLKIISR